MFTPFAFIKPIGPPPAPPTDPDAQDFIDATGISGVDATAINQLVLDLKGFGLWTKMTAIYPMVGGTSTTCKYNLKDARDLDAAFRLDFQNTWTFSSTGATPNGTNAFANTYLNPFTELTNNSLHISMYSRTQDAGVSGVNMGCGDSDPALNLYQYYNGGGLSCKGGAIYSNAACSPNDFGGTTSTLGLALVTRTGSNTSKLFFNGTELVVNTNTENGSRPNLSIYIGASNWGGYANQFTPHEFAFCTIGEGLDNTNNADLYTAVQAFQTTLNREV